MQTAKSDNPHIEKHELQESAELPESAPNEWQQKYRALSGKYEIVKPIGRGAQASVFLAKDSNGKNVAVKIFDFRDAEDWKAVELLEREVKTLKNLSLDGIPQYIDFIEDNPYFYLIESYIEADSLQKRIDDGWHPSEKQTWEILAAVSQRLSTLHQMTPPIIHRDIKPANILLDTSKKPISVWIIDLGAVTELRMKTHASTIAGTAGYAAPEQFMGRAMPASDIYGLGMTIIHLLSAKAPWEMEMDGLDVQYAPHLPQNLSQDFRDLLDDMVKLNPKTRISSAKEVYDIAISHVHDAQDDALPEVSQKGPKGYAFFLASFCLGIIGTIIIPKSPKAGALIVVICVILLFLSLIEKPNAAGKKIAPEKRIASESEVTDIGIVHKDDIQNSVPAVASQPTTPVKKNPIISLLIPLFFIVTAIGILVGSEILFIVIPLLPLLLIMIIMIKRR